MKIVFFGTGEFGIPSLKKIIESDHEIVCIVTQPDKKKGRGWNSMPTPIKAVAEKILPGINILQPEKSIDENTIEYLSGLEPDVFVVIDYGRILKKEVLEIPQKFCINLHPSLLPDYRGCAPINWAIINGETKTGNTVFEMNDKMDAGRVILQDMVEITSTDDSVLLFTKLSQKGADLVCKVLDDIENERVEFMPQDESCVTYAPKLSKKDGEINWKESAVSISRKVRGMQPWPGTYTYLNGKQLKLFEVNSISDMSIQAEPGVIIDDNKFIVKTGEGALEITSVQLEGKKRMNSSDFLRGHNINNGIKLG